MGYPSLPSRLMPAVIVSIKVA
jgi:hypothetical protein